VVQEQKYKGFKRQIEFLRTEVENEERISMAVRGFDSESENDKAKRMKPCVDTNRDNPSANLFTTRMNRDCVYIL